MKKQLSMLAILVGASLNAQAAQSSFFTIVDDEVKGYASGISADGSGLIGINTKNNMAEYFSTVRSADFLVDRFRFEQGCFLSSSVCDSFWDENPGFAYQWRRDFLDKVDQRSNLGYVTSSEVDGLVTALGDVPEVGDIDGLQHARLRQVEGPICSHPWIGCGGATPSAPGTISAREAAC